MHLTFVFLQFHYIIQQLFVLNSSYDISVADKVKKYIGGYVAAMGGVDAIVFTAGLGENSPFMREKICNGLEYLGTRIDPELNKIRGKAREVSIKRARTKIFVIPTNEELVIARDTKRICRRIIDL